MACLQRSVLMSVVTFSTEWNSTIISLLLHTDMVISLCVSSRSELPTSPYGVKFYKQKSKECILLIGWYNQSSVFAFQSISSHHICITVRIYSHAVFWFHFQLILLLSVSAVGSDPLMSAGGLLDKNVNSLWTSTASVLLCCPWVNTSDCTFDNCFFWSWPLSNWSNT